MFMLYFIFIVACISTIRGIVQAIRKKSIKDFILAVLPFPFFFSFFVSVISGGSALHDAKTEYELYQPGHYYLVSHGDWTEVSYHRYMFILISEIIGFSCMAITVVAAIIFGDHRKPKNTLPLKPTSLCDRIKSSWDR